MQRRITMNPEDEQQDTVQTSAHNPFPEPQTIPAGWDTSEMMTASQPDGELEERDLKDQ
jgi:hypothetical protein